MKEVQGPWNQGVNTQFCHSIPSFTAENGNISPQKESTNVAGTFSNSPKLKASKNMYQLID